MKLACIYKTVLNECYVPASRYLTAVVTVMICKQHLVSHRFVPFLSSTVLTTNNPTFIKPHSKAGLKPGLTGTLNVSGKVRGFLGEHEKKQKEL